MHVIIHITIRKWNLGATELVFKLLAVKGKKKGFF